MAKGIKTGGGSRKGKPNKSTVEVREAIAEFAQANVQRMGEWLNAIEDPAKRLDLYLRAIEYHIPKLARTEHAGDPNNPVHVRTVDLSDSALLAIAAGEAALDG